MPKYLDTEGLKHFKSKLQTLIDAKVKITEYTYKFTVNTTSAGQIFSIPNYKIAADSLDVYVNGFKVYLSTDYTVTGTSIRMNKSLNIGTEIYTVIRRTTFTW